MKIGKLYIYIGTTPRKKRTIRVSNQFEQQEKDRKREIIEKYGAVCQCCGAEHEDGKRLELHHIVPVSYGGKNNKSNLVICCRKCHQKMHNIPYFALQQYTILGKYTAINNLEKIM